MRQSREEQQDLLATHLPLRDLERQQVHDPEDLHNQQQHDDPPDRFPTHISNLSVNFRTNNHASARCTEYLDGLRGVASLCVFTQHLMGEEAFMPGFGQRGNYTLVSFPFLRVFWDGGAAAVAVFFVLSGFVISRSVIQRYKNGEQAEEGDRSALGDWPGEGKDGREKREIWTKCKRYLLSAVVRRPIRLYFPCAAVSLMVALMMHLPGKFYNREPWFEAQPTLLSEIGQWAWRFVSYFQPFQRHAWVRGVLPYDEPVWTVPIELKGSMIIYALLGLWFWQGWKAKWYAIGSGAGFLVLMLINEWTIACFLGGSMLSIAGVYRFDGRYWYSRGFKRVKIVLVNVEWVVGYYLLTQPALDSEMRVALETPGWEWLTNLTPSTYDSQDYYRFWQAFGAVMFIHASLHLKWLQILLGGRILQYLGRVSYMLYLVHQPVIITVGFRVMRLFGRIDAGREPVWYDNIFYVPATGPLGLNLQWDACWITILSICLVVAHIGTEYIDRPSIWLARACSIRMDLEKSRREGPRI